MRYSLVLPRAQADDPPDARDALEQARALWASGDYAQALTCVRRAAWASSKAGRESRAVALSKAAVALRHQVDPDNAPTMAPPAGHPSGTRTAPRPMRLPRPTSAAPLAIGQAAVALRSSPTEGSMRIAPTAPLVPRISGIAASNGGGQYVEDAEPEDLVVTVAELGSAHRGTALVAQRALRVAIEQPERADGTIVLRRLEPGEVARNDCPVALLVPLAE